MHTISSSKSLLVTLATALFMLASAQTPLPTRQLREEMRIVSADASLGTSLTAIESILLLRDGRIVTVHSTESVLRVFDSSGNFVTMFSGARSRTPTGCRSWFVIDFSSML